MAFADVLFPKDISYGSQGGPEFSTTIITNGGGYEQRNRNRRVPTWKYNLIYGIKTISQYQELYHFFLAIGAGKWQSFRYEDPIDHLLDEEEIATGDGILTDFQITREYVNTAYTLTRKITKIIGDTVQVWVGTVLQTDGYSVDDMTGLLSFDTAPGNGLSIVISATFHVACRFDIDYLPAIAEARGLNDELILHIESIPLIEDRAA